MGAILELTLADKLYTTKYETDSSSHISVNSDLCRTCSDKPCLRFCSGEVYKLNPSDPATVTVSYENCLECGTCRHGCPFNAIDWRFPDGGMGVKYRYG